MNKNPTICIPFSNVKDREFITNIFKIFGRIKLISINDSKIFIYFNYWYEKKPIVKEIMNNLQKDKFVNIVYDFPWFWRCVIKN